jgi:hypothetical protein
LSPSTSGVEWVREDPDKPDAVTLSGCFSEVLEATEVRERIDAHLRPGARGLPKLALRELLSDSLGLDVQQLAFSRPRPGVLRLAASI